MSKQGGWFRDSTFTENITWFTKEKPNVSFEERKKKKKCPFDAHEERTRYSYN